MEFSTLSQVPQGADQRRMVEDLQGLVKGAGGVRGFVEEGQGMLEEVLQRKQERKMSATTPEVVRLVLIGVL